MQLSSSWDSRHIGSEMEWDFSSPLKMTYYTAVRNKYSSVNTKEENILMIINYKTMRQEENDEFQGQITFKKISMQNVVWCIYENMNNSFNKTSLH